MMSMMTMMMMMMMMVMMMVMIMMRMMMTAEVLTGREWRGMIAKREFQF